MSTPEMHARDKIRLSNFEFVTLLALMMALQALGIDAMLPALGDIARDLDVANANDRQFVIGSYLIGMGLGALIFGFLSDRFGRRPILLGGASIYALLNIACTFAQDFQALIVLRVLTGFASSAGGVVASAVVRDRFEGDKMARTVSLIAMVFLIAPVLAPTIGQAILLFADWRAIFWFLAGVSLVVFVWAYSRLAETHDAQDRQPLEVRRILTNFGIVMRNRDAFGYVFGASLVFSGLYGFINMAEQLLGEHFELHSWFPIVFGLLAASMAATNFINSRIVERYGARPVSHVALCVFVVSGAGQWLVASVAPDSLYLFLPFMMVNMALIGFLGANFSSISLQPFKRIAGSASSLQTSIRIGGGAVLGAIIGAAYDGTARPLGAALFGLGLLGLLMVVYTERGRMFRRRSEQIELV